MSKLELKTYPDPCLRIKTKSVINFSEEIEDLLHLMKDKMYIHQGIGLAATQTGLDVSLLVIDTGDGAKFFLNPEIMEKSKEVSVMEEGCLSLPCITVNVSRPIEIKIKAQDEKGNFFEKYFDGLDARAIQHEIDHLKGKLIIDYLDPIRHFFAARKLKKIKKAYK